MTARKTFADQLSRAEKSKRGRTEVTSTPLAIRSRVPLESVERERIRSLLGRKLAKCATHIERATIRIDDVNGPRGGVDTICKIKIVISGSPSIVVEERGVVVEDVVVVAARVAARAVRREVERRGRSAAKAEAWQAGATRFGCTAAGGRRRQSDRATRRAFP